VRVRIDGVTVLDGFIDTRHKSSAQGTMTISGRDKAGRMVQESAPLFRYGGLGLRELAEQLAAPWFPRVTLSNARNRDLVRGGGAKARARREPPVFNAQAAPRRVEPGQTRWAVLELFVREAGYLAWSAADGEELVIGLPNYEQAPQFRFFHPREGSARIAESNVIELEVIESTADRYSVVVVLGAGRGDAVNFGDNVRRRGVAKNNPATPHGDGRDFSAPKRLVIADDSLRSQTAAQARAEQEMAERDATRLTVPIIAAKHGQLVAGDRPTLFAFDTMAHIEDEETGVCGAFLITKASYRADRQTGEQTIMEAVPKDTRLTL
jgi:prophage tail gpP-like protein